MGEPAPTRLFHPAATRGFEELPPHWDVLDQSSFVNGECALHERLGQRLPIRIHEEYRQTVERRGDGGMVWTEAGLADREGPPYEWLGIIRPVVFSQQLSQIVERDCKVRMLGAADFSSIAMARRNSGSASSG